MQLDIITPDTKLFSGEVSAITLPGIDGSLGILENHTPLITTLQNGEIVVITEEGEKTFEAKGGVVEVLQNKVIILAE